MSRPFNSPDVFRAVAHPVRRKVLEVLMRKGELSPGELAPMFEMSWPALSDHLRALRQAGLIAERRSGRNLLYTCIPWPLAQIHAWVLQFPGMLKTPARASRAS